VAKIRSAEAVWEGGLQDGQGVMRFGSGAFEGSYSYESRFGDGTGTNPEELIAAAQAGCFSMALSADLGKAGFTPKRIETRAKARLEKVDGMNTITEIHLETEADVPSISEQTFLQIAEGARRGCPVSRALGGVEVTLTARLVRS
jgi:osmotically inducible protein OsmC